MSDTPPTRDELFNAIPTPATLVDARGCILNINEAYSRYLRRLGVELRPEERIGRPIGEFAHSAADRHTIEHVVAQALSSGESHLSEVTWRDPRGRTRYIDIHAESVRRADARAIGVLITREDVTERVHQRLRQAVAARVRQTIWSMRSRADIGALLSAIREGLISLDVRFDGLGVNVVEGRADPPDLRYYEYRRNGQVTRWETPEHPGDRLVVEIWRQGESRYRPDLETEDAHREREYLSLGFRTAIRSVVDIPFSHGTLAINSSAPQAFSSADLSFMEALAAFLSEGFQRLEDLAELERRAQEAEALAAAIAVVARAGNVDEVLDMVVSEAARLTTCRCGVLYLYDEQEGFLLPRSQVGHDWEVFRHVRLRPGEGRPGRVFVTGRPAAADEAGEGDAAGLCPENVELFARSLRVATPGSGIAVPLRLSEQVIGALSVGGEQRPLGDRDVHMVERLGEQAALAIDRARQVEALAVRAGELEQQIAQRAALEEQLRQSQKMEAVGQLTAGIAHNFNNLLQGVLGNIGLARDEAPAPMRQLLEDAERAGRRAAELVQQLMLFAHQGARPAYEPVDVGRLVHDVAAMSARTFDRRIRIDVDAREGVAWARGNAGQLEQVLLNLLINARDAVDIEGERAPGIRIVVEQVARPAPDAGAVGTRQWVRVSVEDNGCGMDPETRERIFEPFFTTKEVGAGTGLGLSTVYGIVHRHGGSIDCESRPGEGSCFSLVLPAAPGKPPADSPPPGLLPRGSETLLVIDDEEVVRHTAALILERCGYRVLTAADGPRGLEMLSEHDGEVDLVLLDLSMPRMSGSEVLARLKARQPGLKVLLFTGYAPDVSQFEGISGVAQKPFRAAGLTGLVRRVLDS